MFLNGFPASPLTIFCHTSRGISYWKVRLSIPEKCRVVTTLSFCVLKSSPTFFEKTRKNQSLTQLSSKRRFLTFSSLAFVAIPRVSVIKSLWRHTSKQLPTINKKERSFIMQDSTSKSTMTGPQGPAVLISPFLRCPQHSSPDMVPSSPRHDSNEFRNGATQQPFLSDEPSQPSVFVSFDNCMASDEESSNKEMEIQTSGSNATLSRSSSFDSVDMEMEMLDVSMEPFRPAALRRMIPSPGRSQYSSKSTSSYRPSDPVARFLLTK
jgi:hypothetical protein